MKFIDIGLMAMREDKNQFEQIMKNCKYYAVMLPHKNDLDACYMLFDNNMTTEIRIIGALELKYFAQSSKIIFQNGNEIFMNFDGK